MLKAVVVAILAAMASFVGGSGQGAHLGSVPSDPTQLRADLDLAEKTIDTPGSPTAEIQSAGQFEQLATEVVARWSPRAQRSALAGLDPPAAAAMRVNLGAAGALARLVTPRKSLPPWRIVAPPHPATLLGFFRAAQARSGVPWQYLAAIEFVETKFGRVHGLSTAGAEGPMQFLPATWARYGVGDVHDPRDAILGAARYLAANGAPRDMPDALFHYNPSSDYVRAITDYAQRMRSDPASYYGYYWWQVIYDRRGKPVILPVGYPRVRPVPVR